MTKKKKITRGNPAAVVQPKVRGGRKPSTSLGNSSVAVKPTATRHVRKKADWKKVSVIAIGVVLATVFIVTTVFATVPTMKQEQNPYNAPNVSQNQ